MGTPDCWEDRSNYTLPPYPHPADSDCTNRSQREDLLWIRTVMKRQCASVLCDACPQNLCDDADALYDVSRFWSSKAKPVDSIIAEEHLYFTNVRSCRGLLYAYTNLCMYLESRRSVVAGLVPDVISKVGEGENPATESVQIVPKPHQDPPQLPPHSLPLSPLPSSYPHLSPSPQWLPTSSVLPTSTVNSHLHLSPAIIAICALLVSVVAWH